MTLIFLSPPDFRMTVNSVCSSTGSGSGGGGARRDGDGGGCRHAPLLLEHLGELGSLEDGQLGEIVGNFARSAIVCSSFRLNC